MPARMRRWTWGLLPLGISVLLIAAGCPTPDARGDANALAQLPPRPAAAFPHEPLGFERIAEHSFSAVDLRESALAGEWRVRTPRGFRLRTRLATLSPDSAAWEFTFRRGQRAGVSPVRIDAWSSLRTRLAVRYSELYVSTRMRLMGDAFENQKVGTKLWYVGYGNTRQANDAFLMLEGNRRSAALESAMRLVMYVSPSDDREGGSRPIKQNLRRTPVFTVGAWHHVEVLLKVGDPDRQNGAVHIWVDGVKVTDRTDVKFLDSDYDFTQGFFFWQWTPVWGGVGGVRTRDNAVQLDHIYLSGRRGT